MKATTVVRRGWVLLLGALLAACAGCAATYTVGVTVSGLTGAGLVLQNNLGNDLPISANGTFTFTTPIASGATFSVTLLRSPARVTIV